jgi:acylglycerol lipase
MASSTEGTHTLADGHELYTLTWSPSSTPTARLVFLHGFSDTTNQHSFLFQSLASNHNIKTYAFDQRGWGRSVHAPNQKGLSGGTQQIMDDITHFIQGLPAEEADVPLFLMGHSMGGGEILYYAATGGPAEVKAKIRGFIAEAPWIAVHEDTRPYTATVVIGRALGKIFPHRQMVQKLDSSKLCRDSEVCKAWEKDEECHDTGTLEGLAAALDRGSALETGKVVLKDGVGEGGKTRLLVAFGTADAVVSYGVARKWYEGTKVEDKEFRAYEGWYHNLDMEPGEDKVTFANDIAKWITERSGPLEGGKAKL